MAICNLVIAAAVAIATAAAAWWALPRLRVPDSADSDVYSRLRTPWFVIAVGIVSLCGGIIVGYRIPNAPLAWLGLTGPAAWAVCIDARTRYLPRQLSVASWVFAAAGLGLGWPIWGAAGVLRGVAGAAAGLALGWLAWRFLQFGFGDARLMTITVGSAAAVSASCAFTGLLVGSIVGAIVGLVVATHRRSGGEYAYGPALWAGPFLALLLYF